MGNATGVGGAGPKGARAVGAAGLQDGVGIGLGVKNGPSGPSVAIGVGLRAGPTTLGLGIGADTNGTVVRSSPNPIGVSDGTSGRNKDLNHQIISQVRTQI